MYRDPRFSNRQGIGRNDEVLFQAVNEATCWFSSGKNDCINISLHPAELVTVPGDCQPAFSQHPMPTCQPHVPVSRQEICTLDTKIVGTGSCIVLERKIGGQPDHCATELCRFDYDAAFAPDVAGVAQWADTMVSGRDGFLRLRVIRYDGQEVYARFHLKRQEKIGVVHLK